MASDDKKVKAGPAQKSDAAVKSKGPSGVDLSKAEGGETAADRGRRQRKGRTVNFENRQLDAGS